jgi:hypothetical protein
MKREKRLSQGNGKLKDVLIFDLPTGKTCPNCEQCYKTCYARKAERCYPNVLPFREFNLELTRKPKLFRQVISAQLYRAKRIMPVRIHSSGDFYCQRYINNWTRIIDDFSDRIFYAYTKAKRIFDFSEIESLPNFNLINSIVNRKFLNYGPENYIRWLKREFGCYICPVTMDKRLKCNHDCTHCHTKAHVVFKKH